MLHVFLCLTETLGAQRHSSQHQMHNISIIWGPFKNTHIWIQPITTKSEYLEVGFYQRYFFKVLQRILLSPQSREQLDKRTEPVYILQNLHEANYTWNSH